MCTSHTSRTKLIKTASPCGKRPQTWLITSGEATVIPYRYQWFSDGLFPLTSLEDRISFPVFLIAKETVFTANKFGDFEKPHEKLESLVILSSKGGGHCSHFDKSFFSWLLSHTYEIHMHTYNLLDISWSHKIHAVCRLHFPHSIVPEFLSILQKHHFNDLHSVHLLLWEVLWWAFLVHS